MQRLNRIVTVRWEKLKFQILVFPVTPWKFLFFPSHPSNPAADCVARVRRRDEIRVRLRKSRRRLEQEGISLFVFLDFALRSAFSNFANFPDPKPEGMFYVTVCGALFFAIILTLFLAILRCAAIFENFWKFFLFWGFPCRSAKLRLFANVKFYQMYKSNKKNESALRHRKDKKRDKMSANKSLYDTWVFRSAARNSNF